MIVIINPFILEVAGGGPAVPSYYNSGGEGPRNGIIITSSTNMTYGQGGPDQAVNGSSANDFYFIGGTGNGTAWMQFDFGFDKVIDEFTWAQQYSQSHGTWRIEGSPDAASWTQIDADFTLDTGTFPLANTTAYRYYRLRHMSGNRSSGPWLYELRFKIDEPGAPCKYTNTGGRGDRTGVVTATATNIAPYSTSTPQNLLNGALGTDVSTSYAWLDGTGNGTEYITFDFGSAKIVNQFAWYQSQVQSQGTWRWEGSNDASSWTTIGADLTLQHGTFYRANSTPYRYYRLLHLSGARSVSFWQQEMLFQISV